MMKNEKLRQRLVELHSIYMTPAPDAYIARRVVEPEVVFLPGVEPTISTVVHTITKANRGKEFSKQSTITIDPERVAAAIEAVGTDIVGLMLLVDAEQAGHAPSGEPVWKVKGVHAGEKATSVPMISDLHVVRASDGMFVTAPDTKSVLNCLKRYEDAYHPAWTADIFDPFKLTTTTDVVVTDVTVVRRRPPPVRPGEKPSLIDCYWIRGHQSTLFTMTNRLSMVPRFIDNRAVRPFVRCVFVAPDGALASVHPFSGKPDPTFYLERKEHFSRQKEEAETKAREEALKADLASRTEDEVDDDEAITGAFL